MPDCSNEAIVKVLRDMADNVVAGTTALADQAKAIDFASGLAQTSDVLGDLGTAAIQSATSQILSSASGLSYVAGLGSVAGMLATLLSGGKLAYLGVAAFLFSLLRYDLEARVLVSSSLSSDMQALSAIITIMINLSIKGSDEVDLVLQRAYEQLFSANTRLGNIDKQLKAREYYSTDEISIIESELDKAQEILDTPILDALVTIAEGAHFFPAEWEMAHNAQRKPASAYEDLYSVTDNGFEERDEDAYKTYAAGQAATREENLNTFMSGVMEYFDYTGTVGLLDMKVKELAMNIVNYLPLDPSAKAAMLSNFAPKISKAPADSAAPLTVDFTDISYRGLIEENSASGRPLGNLNESIKTRLTYLSKYNESFQDMALVNSLTANGISGLSGQLDELTDDVEQYVPYPVGSPDQDKPEVNIASTAAKSFKMMAWKSRIESVKRNLDALNGSFGEQAESIGESFENLDAILELVNTYTEEVSFFNSSPGFYNDGNDHTPEGEDSFLQIHKLVGMLFGDLTSKGGLEEIQTQLSECQLSLSKSIAADNAIISAINNFTSGILDSPGMQTQLAFLNSVLENPALVSSNNTLKYIIDEFKKGNIQLVTNLSLGAIQEAGTIGQAGLDAINNMPSVGEMSDTFMTAMGSIGSAFSNIGECIGQLGSASIAEQARVAAEASATQAAIKTEILDAASASVGAGRRALQKTLDIMNGIEIPEADQPLSGDNMLKVKDSANDAYASVGVPSVDDMGGLA